MIYLDVYSPAPETGTVTQASVQNETAARMDRIAGIDPARRAAKKSPDKTYCPYCGRESVLIWVHGHYQCSRCKYVVVGCCEAN